MAVDFNYDVLVAQDFSSLTECRLRAVRPDFTESRHWLANFMLNSIFASVSAKRRAWTFAILRRAEAALEQTDEASEELARFVGSKKTLSSYFRIMRNLQGAVANTWQAFEFARLGEKIYARGDGSRYERLAQIYNASRHADPLVLPDGHIQIDWITNEGLHVNDSSRQHSLSFEDLRACVVDLAELADEISSAPGSR